MTDQETLERRLRAVERALTDGDDAVAARPEVGALTDRVDRLEAALADAEEQIAELEAATQALRGYVGNVRSVNESVERRADAALAVADRVESRLESERRPADRSVPQASGSAGGAGDRDGVDGDREDVGDDRYDHHVARFGDGRRVDDEALSGNDGEREGVTGRLRDAFG